MNVLEKILEEIESEKRQLPLEAEINHMYKEGCVAGLDVSKEIIRSHMDDVSDENDKDFGNSVLLMLNKDGIAEVYDDRFDITIHCESKEEQEKIEELLKNVKTWIPIYDRLPENNNYILLSFENFSIPAIGRCETSEDGEVTFYIGDDEKSCSSNGLFVNAWQPLPEQYKGE